MTASSGWRGARASLARAVSSWHTLAVGLAAAALASLPSLSVGFSNDDLSQRVLLEGAVPDYPISWLGLYDFTPPSMPSSALIERGFLPWFTDPELRLRFLRPLSSATLALDEALFGRSALLAHVHSALWMLALAFFAAQLYRRWLAPPVATLAALIFGLSGVHAMPVSWLASRHSLVSATFGALALWSYARYREQGEGRGLALALAALAGSLLSSESGLVAVVLLASYELGLTGLRRGLARAALPLAMGAAYLVAYAGLGYGTRASDFYVSPFDAPLAYAGAALLGVPALGAELVLGVPSIAGLVARAALIALAVLGALAMLAVFLLLRALSSEIGPATRRRLACLGLGTLIGMLGLVGAPVSGRVLPLPALIAAALMAQLLYAAWQRAHARAAGEEQAAPQPRWWLAVGAVVLFQLGVSPLMRLALTANFRKGALDQEQLARQADVGACTRGGTLYLINGSDPTLALYTGPALRFHTPEKAGAEHLYVLSMAPQRQRLTRSASDTLELAVLDEPRTSHAFERLLRGVEQPLRPGQEVALEGLTVHVDATSDGLFTRSRFQTPRDLDATRDCLLVWRNGRLENVPLPRLGEELEIEHAPGPMGL